MYHNTLEYSTQYSSNMEEKTEAQKQFDLSMHKIEQRRIKGLKREAFINGLSLGISVTLFLLLAFGLLKTQ